MRKDAAEEIAQELTAILAAHGQRKEKEYHWTELKKHTLPMYREAVQSFLGQIRITGGKLRYRALIVDNHKVRHSLNAGGNREDTLAKFIFTLVFGFVRDFGPQIHYHVWIDSRSSITTDDVRTRCSLNNKVKSELGWDTQPFKIVRFVESHKSRLIQATDLITGAIAYETNGRHRASDASAHRRELMEHTAKCAKLTTLAKPHYKWPWKFIIGHFDFEKSKLLKQAKHSSALDEALDNPIAISLHERSSFSVLGNKCPRRTVVGR
jgi:hypothetical protein